VGLAALVMALSNCASLRSNTVFGLQFSQQPARAFIRATCNGQSFTTQGTVVCEQKEPSQADISVKVLPLEGRVVYSNGQLKKTEDFNWYPKEGFFIWKKKPIKDTWISLDLGDVASTFGDWPVSMDIMAVSDDGVINTKGIIYHRICNDTDIPCSRLVLNYECAGHNSFTGLNKIGKCDRLAGSEQAFAVQLKTPNYEVKSGAKLYLSVPRKLIATAIDISDSELSAGIKKFEVPAIETGPTLVGARVVWYDGLVKKSAETRVLIVGTMPEWTGLDQPHYMDKNDNIDFVQPVLANLMEVNSYDKTGALVSKKFGKDKLIKFPKPEADQIACAFAWQRDSSDLEAVCLDKNMNEVHVP
jgi:hypothetical protein